MSTLKIQLITVGANVPKWVEKGFKDYQNRFPSQMPLDLVGVKAEKRGNKTDSARVLKNEGKAMLAAIPEGNRIVALDIPGILWDTHQLAAQLSDWILQARNLSILIGGPDGLSRDCQQAAEHIWSLSPLTFPHQLVRIIVAESLYRAWSLKVSHPYHRE